MKRFDILALIVLISALIYALWQWIVGVRHAKIIEDYTKPSASPSPFDTAPTTQSPKIVPPVTPLSMRACDGKGCGHYGASRGGRTHKGVDFVVSEGQKVVSPIAGRIKRTVDVYGDGEWQGLYIEGADFDIKIFYLNFNPSVVGMSVSTGTPIATARNIQDKYGSDMTPHIHLEVWSMGSQIDPTPFFN
jgi:murein DD-endopeptidase MepM/ murein hydrolase activator NlpD